MVTQPVSSSLHGPHAAHGPTTCLNCQHEYEGRFCPNCGQRADTHRINWHYLWHEIPHSVWHYDRGILFTLRELLTRPGHTIREFLEGKRINHYRPLALLIMTAGVLFFVEHFLHVSVAESTNKLLTPSDAPASDSLKAFQSDINQWLERNRTLLNVLQIPMMAFGFWLLFKKKGLNYPEFLVTQTFVACFTMVISLFVTILSWALGIWEKAFYIVFIVIFIAQITYTALTYRQLFANKLKPVTAISRAVTGWIVGYIFFISIVAVVSRTVFWVWKAQHPAKPTITTQQPAPPSRGID